MAERRMFSKSIIDSDAFLALPLTAQTLYFHLSMRADDEGFIDNSKSIMRSIGCGREDLEALLSEDFILCFENGIVVIKHWKQHNYIYKDRFKKTRYVDEREQLEVDENGVYTLTELTPDVTADKPVERDETDCECQVIDEDLHVKNGNLLTGYENFPVKNGNLLTGYENFPVKNGNLLTQVSKGKVSKGKVSEGKVSEGKVSEGKVSEGKYISKEKGEKEKNDCNAVDKPDRSEAEKPSCRQVAELYNEICISYPKISLLSTSRKKTIYARLKDYTLSDFKTLFEKAEASSFLKGSNQRSWSANFDWLIKDTNMAKVIDGNYDNRTDGNSAGSDSAPKYFAFPQRQYSDEEMMEFERKALHIRDGTDAGLLEGS